MKSSTKLCLAAADVVASLSEGCVFVCVSLDVIFRNCIYVLQYCVCYILIFMMNFYDSVRVFCIAEITGPGRLSWCLCFYDNVSTPATRLLFLCSWTVEGLGCYATSFFTTNMHRNTPTYHWKRGKRFICRLRFFFFFEQMFQQYCSLPLCK